MSCGLKADVDFQYYNMKIDIRQTKHHYLRECSSVGRASGCHPEGREFESLHSLSFIRE